MTTITCDICPRECKLQEGQTGFCNVRKNVNGGNVDAQYGLFFPNPEDHNPLGSYTVVTPGCNLQCSFCDVPFITLRFRGDTTGYRRFTPRELVEKVLARAGGFRGGLAFQNGLLGYFGGEPPLHYEFILEASRICRDRGAASKMYTAGFINPPIMERLAKAVDSMAIGVKCCASPRVYRQFGADPASVLESIKIAWENCPDLWLANMVGPGLEPTLEEIDAFASWLRENTDPDVRTILEAMLPPAQDQFPSNPSTKLIPGDSRFQMLTRIERVASRLVDRFGFTNVWVDYHFRYPSGAREVPEDFLPHGKATCRH